MGIKPVIASTLYNDKVQNISIIHGTTLCCSFFNILRE